MPDLKTRLLIVDDEPGTRLLLSQIFTRLGHDVLCAADGFAALQLMRDRMPDIILSDLNMPGMSGFEFLSVVRRRLPSIYVVATSGAYFGSAVPEGIAADAFYEKATGLTALFQIMKAARNPESAAPRNLPIPIWISLDRGALAGDQGLAIPCPDCLRVFVRTPPETAGIFHTESCSFCDSTIHYAVVKVLAAVSEQKYQALLGMEMAGPRSEMGDQHPSSLQ